MGCFKVSFRHITFAVAIVNISTAPVPPLPLPPVNSAVNLTCDKDSCLLSSPAVMSRQLQIFWLLIFLSLFPHWLKIVTQEIRRFPGVPLIPPLPVPPIFLRKSIQLSLFKGNIEGFHNALKVIAGCSLVSMTSSSTGYMYINYTKHIKYICRIEGVCQIKTKSRNHWCWNSLR